MERRNASFAVAFGGVMAAVSVVIMCLGTLIPVATFVCPMLCILLAKVVLGRCGSKIALAWYGAVSLLSLLLAPDKEATAVFAALGYYPVIKPKLEQLPLSWLWKGILFNIVILVLYWLLMHIFGMAQLLAEFREMGIVMTIVTLILGNICFFLMDVVLSKRFRFRR
ncbi:MAG: hypothetical protein J6Q30_00380 [Oscillospiraceae bacterium]|nr:hypothetical protein [Oscillospiraceae bacterium]